MVKAYLRYEPASTWGVIASAGGAAYDATGRLLATACLERVGVWSLKQGAQVRALAPPAPPSGAAPATVTVLARAPGGARLAAGYADGAIRIWNVASGECITTLHGHKSGVSALRFNRAGGLLASGGRDTDVIVWDVAAEAGLYRLKGHRDAVTDLAFVERGGRLLSCSKDSHVRVWELATQHCCQTLVGHRCEVWALDVDPAERRLVTGAADAALRVFALRDDDAGALPPDADGALLAPMGQLARPGGGDRVAALRFSPRGGVLAVAPAGRLVELWEVHASEEARRRAKRRRKRKRDKLETKAAAAAAAATPGTASAAAAVAAAAPPAAAEDDDAQVATDEFSLMATLPLKAKALALAFAPEPRPGALVSFAVTLANNAAEAYDLLPSGGAGEGGDEAAAAVARRCAEVASAGHRADVRAVALASDDSLLLSTSHAGAKIWNPKSGACLRSVECGYGLCAAFAPGARHALVGTKAGELLLLDVAAASVTRTLPAHGGPLWSLALAPDGGGFVTGGGDKEVKFWDFCMAAPEASADADAGADTSAPQTKTLSARHMRTLRLPDDVLCVRYSPDGKLLAVALLDATMKVFFADTLKFFLSLYGHKLPVLAMDVSDDGALLASGGADKNLKLWGLDFGDCHASLRAHDDSVTALAFVPRTHYLFTASKDRTLKYWDADARAPLLTLAGHAAELWGLAVSSSGDFVVTAGHDRALRRWERTEEPFFVEEERERRLESLFEEALEDAPEKGAPGDGGDPNAAPGEGAVGLAGRRSMAALGAAESVVDALEIAAAEVARRDEWEADAAKARAMGGGGSSAFTANPLLLGLSPDAFVQRAVAAVRNADLEYALLLLPFASALQLLDYLPGWLAGGSTSGELACAVAVLLLRLHQRQLAGTPAARPVMLRLRRQLRPRLQALKDVMGFNMAATAQLKRLLADQRGAAALM